MTRNTADATFLYQATASPDQAFASYPKQKKRQINPAMQDQQSYEIDIWLSYNVTGTRGELSKYKRYLYRGLPHK